jgi:hypothetical protein
VLLFQSERTLDGCARDRSIQVAKQKSSLTTAPGAVPAVVSMSAPASAAGSVPVCIIPRLLTILDASKYLSATTWQIEELVRNNIVPSFILGQRRVIDRLELDPFVDRRAALPSGRLTQRTANFAKRRSVAPTESLIDTAA